MAFLLSTDLAWVLTHCDDIRRIKNPARIGTPVLAWPDGKVRVEWVGTYASAMACRREWEPRLQPTGATP